MSKYTLTLVVAMLLGVSAAAVAQESKWIAVLKSDVNQQEKSDACRELARIGTKESVPVLASLLGDEHLSHMARYALEPIRDPAVDAALREALERVEGRPLLGVIGSLGVRRDAQAVPALAKKLTGADDAVIRAAARALGNIGTPQAVAALEGALDAASPANRLDICEGLFRCAESLSAQRKQAEAQAVYDRVRALAQAPKQIRSAALRGAILTRGNGGIPLLVEAVRSADSVLTTTAARTAMEMPQPEVTAALVAELGNVSADKQVLLIKTLGYRGDASAGPALLGLMAEGSKEVRLAVIANLTHLGYTPALPHLAKLSLGNDPELAAAARTYLSSFPGKEADAAVEGMLSHQDATIRALAVEMIAVRHAGDSAKALLKAAADGDEAVRTAALKALRDQAGVADLPALIDLVRSARSAAELQLAENALTALCARQAEPATGNVTIVKAEYGVLGDGPSADVTKKVAALVQEGALAVEASNGNFGDPANGKVKALRVDYAVNGVRASKTAREGETVAFTAVSTPPAIVDAICEAVGSAKPEARSSLLRTLRSAGGAKALATVEAAARDADAAVQETALRALCDWPTPDALPLLVELAKNGPSNTIKVLALRGWIRLAPQQNASEGEKLSSLKEALALAERDVEKKSILSALGDLSSADALAVVAGYLDNSALKDEASLAAVAIAERIGKPTAEVLAAMKQVAAQNPNSKVGDRAKAILAQAKP